MSKNYKKPMCSVRDGFCFLLGVVTVLFSEIVALSAWLDLR
jgi:hypothetical protein